MSVELDEPPAHPSVRREERAGQLGWGIGLLVAGGLMIAKQFGWVEGVDWLVPAVIIGLATKHLFNALCR